ncbi:MAG: hypothetical protein KAI94_02505, partial [Anaerolineales bacterium]|nr:hypothetical protein [Anaerolineales bacterium]
DHAHRVVQIGRSHLIVDVYLLNRAYIHRYIILRNYSALGRESQTACHSLSNYCLFLPASRQKAQLVFSIGAIQPNELQVSKSPIRIYVNYTSRQHFLAFELTPLILHLGESPY